MAMQSPAGYASLLKAATVTLQNVSVPGITCFTAKQRPRAGARARRGTVSCEILSSSLTYGQRGAKWTESQAMDGLLNHVGGAVSNDLGKMQAEMELLVAGVKQTLAGWEREPASLYAVAWIARVPATDDEEVAAGPQFPLCLDYIVQHQLHDGSWGNPALHPVFERFVTTLACVVGLASWPGSSHTVAAVQRGVKFLQLAQRDLPSASPDQLPIGFQIVVPRLVEEARALGLRLEPYDHEGQDHSRVLVQAAMRKLGNEYPLESLRYAVHWKEILEEWDREGRLDAVSGAPLAAVAACCLHTRDTKCLHLLSRAVQQLHSPDPKISLTSADLLEALRVTDRIYRLGLSDPFKQEVQEFLRFLHSHCWSPNRGLLTMDDTATAFLLLRVHGFPVSPGVFERFRKPGGEMVSEDDSVSTVLSFYRASQSVFPGEDILEADNLQALRLLQEKHDRNEHFDDWVVGRDLKPQFQVQRTLNRPWHASVYRCDEQAFIDAFVPAEDFWIGKSLYKTPCFINQALLQLAKANFNLNQSIHAKSMEILDRWYLDCRLDEINLGKRGKVRESYFVAWGSGILPEFPEAVIASTQNTILTTLTDDYFDLNVDPFQELEKFVEAIRRWDPSVIENGSEVQRVLFFAIYNTINATAEAASRCQGRDVSHELRTMHLRLVEAMLQEAEWTETGFHPSIDDYLRVAETSVGLEPIVLSALMFMPHKLSTEVLEGPEYPLLLQLVSKSFRLMNDARTAEREIQAGKFNTLSLWLEKHPEAGVAGAEAYVLRQSEEAMRQLVQAVFLGPPARREPHSPLFLPPESRQLFLGMARVVRFFYYKSDGWSNPQETELHGQVSGLLFRPFS